MQTRFELKKSKILKLLEAPEDDYQDLSPKGSLDESIRPLIGDINRITGLVTTSSCSGRVSVFCEGKNPVSDHETVEREADAVRAGPGGKGSGVWLFTSHSPIKVSPEAPDRDWMALFGLKKNSPESENTHGARTSYIHLKFEPMILHILTASLEDSQHVLTAALSAGFRESGAVSLSTPKGGEITPMVAVRSTGYSFDAIIGYQDTRGENIALVDETYLRTLVDIANERFKVNDARIARFQSALQEQYMQRHAINKSSKPAWEDPEARRQRKREEGLARRQQLINESLANAETSAPGHAEDIRLTGDFPQDSNRS